ncbi:MAG: ribonucleoside-diphosphate reductase beta chain, partial [Solirubrobacteraceae bacterium]|nr:ribonucleoside-diphosphate reductase beta chain [Solirubrobacteraceae bacterium]
IADPQSIGAHVARSREQLGDSFRVIFDEALVQAHERLAANPRDAEAKVEFVTMYHLIIEGTLGLTAFHFITQYLGNQGLLAGFVDGYSRIHHDEQRHIGYGVWYLREAVGRDEALGDAMRRTLRDLLPAVAEALAPPDREGTDWEALGASADEVREFALSGLRRRLSIVGVPLETL